MTLKWGYVDFEARCLRLPDTKTGARVVHLGAPALEVLSRLERRPGNPWVICGRNPGARRTDLQPPWQRFRKRATVRLWAQSEGTPGAALVARLESKLGREPAYEECLAAAKKQDLELPTGLVDVRIHDLRHSFASGAVALGESLPMIGKLLGHTQVQTTARYAHLAADPVKAAAERVSSNIAALINGQTGEVVQLLPRTGEPRRARVLGSGSPMKRLEPLASPRPEADHDAGGRGGAGTEAKPRRDAGQGARPAHRWRRRIERGQAKSITDLAEQEGVTDAYDCRLLPLTCMAPDIVEAILDGQQPKGLRLAEMLGNGPLAWNAQREAWGFSN